MRARFFAADHDPHCRRQAHLCRLHELRPGVRLRLAKDEDREEQRVTIELTTGEYEFLLVMLGMALGTADHYGDTQMMRHCLEIINAVGRNSPGFIPYAVAPEEPQA
jgi:hypothetical protein